MDKQDNWLSPAYFFAKFIFFSSFCKKKWKIGNSFLILVFKGFPQISIPSLISAFFGITELSRLRSKIRRPRYFSAPPSKTLKISCEILILEIQRVLIRKMSLTIEKSRYKSDFYHFQPVRMQGILFKRVYRENLSTDKIVKLDFD